MKKIITTVLLLINSSKFALAQLNIGGTLGNVPLSISIGKGASSIGGVGGGGGGPLLQLLATAQTLVSRLVPFMVGLGMLAFFWFLIQFIWKGDESGEARSTSMKGMGYSILALFVMVSIWGIIGVLGSMLGVAQGGGLPPLQMPSAK